MGFYDKNPCKGCKVRHMGCHADCENYAEWKSNLNDNKTKWYEERSKENYLSRFQKETADRLNNRRGGYKKK